MKINIRNLCLVLLTISLLPGCKDSSKLIYIDEVPIKATPLYKECFSDGLSNWTIEQLPGGSVTAVNQQMDINDSTGCTVWFKKKLKAPLMIEYDAVVINAGGPNDRVSDLNCFWLAQDIHSPDDFFARSKERGGKFQNYHDMKLYYVGLGGHDNTKTRFRKYAGGGDRPCLPEHDLSDQQYLITPNTNNHIRIVVFNNRVQYYRNDLLIYDYTDDAPYKEGYFGIRTYKNHMTVDNFTVYQLSQK